MVGHFDYPLRQEEVEAIIREGIEAVQTGGGSFRAEALAGWICGRYNVTRRKPEKVKIPENQAKE